MNFRTLRQNATGDDISTQNVKLYWEGHNRQWCIAKNGGGYTQTGVAKGLKVPCLFMIAEVSIYAVKKTRRLVYAVYPRIPPPQYTTDHRSGPVRRQPTLRSRRPTFCRDVRTVSPDEGRRLAACQEGGCTVLTVRVRYIIKAPLVSMGLSN